ncbi:MAG TPA: patatin-like phospholipase family protein [Acetobacteraceae bacterium]|nr:patatin-like phospholipase family protein [Acetobacteraceae bacterium]
MTKETVTGAQEPCDTSQVSAAKLPGQVVLAFQGGGALGAYQAGVYEALHEAGIEPDWVIGTSIGAINGAIIAGNEPARRMDRLRAFWHHIEYRGLSGGVGLLWPQFQSALASAETILEGVPGFFSPNFYAWLGLLAPVGVDRAALYSVAALADTLMGLVDLERLKAASTRFTVGAVKIRNGEMIYFDSRDRAIGLEHVLASSALPPAFPGVRIEDEIYWDGGVYSNTPMEVVFDDNPRRNSVVFAVHLWNPVGPEPESIWQVLGRQKEIQYSSRIASHIARHEQIHRLRHIIRKLAELLPPQERDTPEVRNLCAYGCHTVMHFVQLYAPRNEDQYQTRDIDFTSAGIRTRWQAGYADASRALAERPWENSENPMSGVVVHEITNPEAAAAR